MAPSSGWVGYLIRGYLNVLHGGLGTRRHVPVILNSRVSFFAHFGHFVAHILSKRRFHYVGEYLLGALLHGASVGGVRVST